MSADTMTNTTNLTVRAVRQFEATSAVGGFGPRWIFGIEITRGKYVACAWPNYPATVDAPPPSPYNVTTGEDLESRHEPI